MSSCCCTSSCEVWAFTCALPRSSWWPPWFYRTSKCCGESACIVPDSCDWQGTPHSWNVLEIIGVYQFQRHFPNEPRATQITSMPFLPAMRQIAVEFYSKGGRPRPVDVGSSTVWMFPSTGIPCLEVTVKRGRAKSQWSWIADPPAKLVLQGSSLQQCVWEGRQGDFSFLRHFIPELQRGHCVHHCCGWTRGSPHFLSYHVVSRSAEAWSCSCPGFWTHSSCWHSRELPFSRCRGAS